MTRKKLLQLAGEVLIHPPHAPDIAPILVFTKKGKHFNSLEDCKRHLEQFFAQKDTKFSEDEIMKLSEKWQKIVEQNGEYIVQESS